LNGAVLPPATYACVRCATKASASELQALPSPRCDNCGFTVFSKTRSRLVKQVGAV
jgi:DNA-directed RNA polymerase subunit RPC12/RpoP